MVSPLKSNRSQT
jgi:hypothetical protein